MAHEHYLYNVRTIRARRSWRSECSEQTECPDISVRLFVRINPLRLEMSDRISLSMIEKLGVARPSVERNHQLWLPNKLNKCKVN